MKSKEFNKEITGLSISDLLGRASQLAEEHMKLRFSAKSRTLTQSHRLSVVRKNIARVRTELTKRNQAKSV